MLHLSPAAFFTVLHQFLTFFVPDQSHQAFTIWVFLTSPVGNVYFLIQFFVSYFYLEKWFYGFIWCLLSMTIEYSNWMTFHWHIFNDCHSQRNFLFKFKFKLHMALEFVSHVASFSLYVLLKSHFSIFFCQCARLTNLFIIVSKCQLKWIPVPSTSTTNTELLR